MSILTVSAREWPQWRGPNRDGISDEVGLLKEWVCEWSQSALEGPTWRGIFGHLCFSGACLYDVLRRGRTSFIVCLDATDGVEIWRFRSDKNYFEGQGGQRTPGDTDD